MSNGTPCSSQLIWCETKVEKLERELADKIDRNGVLYIRLAEGRAREKVLMVAIESLVENVDRPPDANCSCHISPPCNDCIDYGGLREAFEWVDTALAMPTDDTALRAALKAERERVAKHFESRSYLGSGHQLAIEIRALEDE